jgi:hypothetical protein
MNLKITDQFQLNVLQVAVDDLVEHLKDVPSHDPEEAREFELRLFVAEELKAQLDKMEEQWPFHEQMRETEQLITRHVYGSPDYHAALASMRQEAEKTVAAQMKQNA